jgi:aminoglycoside phosphotransferase (APT) family kinase protein
MFETHVKDDGDPVRFHADIGLDVRPVVTGLLGAWLSRAALEATQVSILAGGAINRSFLVEGADAKHVLRVAPDAEYTDQIGIDMTNSAVVAQIAGDAGVGPGVLGVKLPEGHSLIEFVPGVLNVETLREGERLHDVGLCVRALHALPTAGVRTASTFAEIDDWLASATAQGVASTGGFEQLRPQLERTRDVLEAVEGRCLSHRDLNPQNCIHTGAEVKLIDWDFSGIDSPYLDLAMLTTYADLTEDEARTFLSAAIGDVQPEDAARVQLMRFAHALREWAWTLTARASLVGKTNTDLALLPTEATAADDFYVAYGDVNWGFARRFAADPRFDEWLRGAASDLPAPGFR